jgi:hypothetical protein
MKTSAAWGLSAMRSMRAMCLRCRAVGEVSLETRQMAFHLAYVLLSGDGTITARLASANSSAKAGSDDPRNADGNFQPHVHGELCAIKDKAGGRYGIRTYDFHRVKTTRNGNSNNLQQLGGYQETQITARIRL